MTVFHIDDLKEEPTNKKFFFDTNIWLYLYGPSCDYNIPKVKSYSKFLKTILETENNSIFIDYLVIAEFINRYVRDTHRIHHSDKFDKFKDFRATEDYAEIIHNLSDELFHITQDTEVIYCNLADFDLDELIAQTAEGAADFNDIVIMTICKIKGLSLVTDDADFSSDIIDIYTLNKKYFVK
ncbi:PIN domain-containing protein [Thalassospira lucentensis]|uniref:PIN domain-containing protein n=1 Tax=Thalassospira lucentensis TaxID=168935 RepID=UPI003AA7B801